MRKMIFLSIITMGFILSMDTLANLDVQAATPNTADKTAQKNDDLGPLEFHWAVPVDKAISYDFEQRVEISSNVGQASKPPIEIHGQLELRGLQGKGETSLTLDATRDDLKENTTQVEAKSKDAAKAEIETRAKAKEEQAPRSFFSCSPPPRKKLEPKPKVKVPPRPAATPKMHARFIIGQDGQVRGNGASTGGQTELMMRLLFPLPKKNLKPGEEEKTQIDVSPVGRRFPMLGHRLLKIEGLVDIKGQRCARIVATVSMSGEGRGQNTPGQAAQMKGKMQLTATTRGLFAIEAGYFREAQTELDFSLDTERVVNGQSQKVSLKQHQSSAIVLREETKKGGETKKLNKKNSGTHQ